MCDIQTGSLYSSKTVQAWVHDILANVLYSLQENALNVFSVKQAVINIHPEKLTMFSSNLSNKHAL